MVKQWYDTDYFSVPATFQKDFFVSDHLEIHYYMLNTAYLETKLLRALHAIEKGTAFVFVHIGA